MPRKSKYTFEFLSPIIQQSKRWSEVLTKLGLKIAGGNYKHIKSKTVELGIDTSHFVRTAWNKGLTEETDSRVKNIAGGLRKPDEDVFKKDSTYGTSKLYRRLVALGHEPVCSICGISDWLKQPLRLHVDHINGVNNDNRVENLRFLCPNCHSQTGTYCSRNGD